MDLNPSELNYFCDIGRTSWQIYHFEGFKCLGLIYFWKTADEISSSLEANCYIQNCCLVQHLGWQDLISCESQSFSVSAAIWQTTYNTCTICTMLLLK